MTAGATVLVLNCGSSSIKYELVEPDTGRRRAHGIVERIGQSGARLHHTSNDHERDRSVDAPGHRRALAHILHAFETDGPALNNSALAGVGHRVVMGGVEFSQPTLIDDAVETAIETLSPLAPLHNPANLAGIRVARTAMPQIPHVAVFDTAFFADLPDEATTYAIDRTIAAAHGIRRYGFHGTSHRYVSGRVAELLGRNDLRQIVLHLGNGASAAAVVGGRPMATTMGLTPLEGLVMGSRSGDLDPAIVLYLQRAAGLSVDEVDTLLNRHSGLVGLTGHSDMRDVHAGAEGGDDAARLALDVYVRRIKHYVGGYAAIMGGIDALTFTAGVGEHDAGIRARVVDGLGFLGLRIDPGRNRSGDGERVVSPDGATASVLVVPTDEELAIAHDTLSVVG
ncbi:MAG: acetate kinase [Acidimicrobiia bacterium]|nr:acetate kinase [Acidimicrobiia bacterium]